MADPNSDFNSELEPSDLDELELVDTADAADADLPQEMTQSYGTGVHDQPGSSIGGRTMADRMEAFNEASPILTGGDIDANWEQANAVGDESVGGTGLLHPIWM